LKARTITRRPRGPPSAVKLPPLRPAFPPIWPDIGAAANSRPSSHRGRRTNEPMGRGRTSTIRQTPPNGSPTGRSATNRSAQTVNKSIRRHYQDTKGAPSGESGHGRECRSRAWGSNRRAAIRPPFRRTKMGTFVAGVARRQCRRGNVGLVPCQLASEIAPSTDESLQPDRPFG
jgi:hypothetical protein